MVGRKDPVGGNEYLPTNTFPTAIVDTRWTIPVEVSVIGQLPPGTGTSLYSQMIVRQQEHDRFVNELHEPSTKLGATRLDLKDKTALYTFAVDRCGHPFHRHQGHRVVIAISGSGGADLRFSSATMEEIEGCDASSRAFVDNLHVIRIPSDSLFTMRFDGRIWHQFVPTPCPTGLPVTPLNPAFFAISVHTDETGGMLDERLKRMVENDEATIAALTELLPKKCIDELDIERACISAPMTQLSMESSVNNEHILRFLRGTVGAFSLFQDRANFVGKKRLTGAGFVRKSNNDYSKRSGAHFLVKEVDMTNISKQSSSDNHNPEVIRLISETLTKHLPNANHRDCMVLKLPQLQTLRLSPSSGLLYEYPCDLALDAILEGFLENPPVNVGRLQTLRNVIVRPLGLRTSPLGCPVSSLLSKSSEESYLGKYPVHQIVRDSSHACVGVVLGANDKHLRFRTVVMVDVHVGLVYMATAVESLNMFGDFYLHSINYVHRKFVTPELLRWSAAFASDQLKEFP